MRILFACLACVMFAAATHAQAPAPQNGTPAHNIQLTAAPDVADAAAVNRAITVMVKNVSSCSAAEDAPSCACGFKDDLKKLKAAYDAAVAKHPGWNAENSVVAYINPANGRSVIINLPGIRRQLDACAKR
jgi:hypothetical protein